MYQLAKMSSFNNMGEIAQKMQTDVRFNLIFTGSILMPSKLAGALLFTSLTYWVIPV